MQPRGCSQTALLLSFPPGGRHLCPSPLPTLLTDGDSLYFIQLKQNKIDSFQDSVIIALGGNYPNLVLASKGWPATQVSTQLSVEV